MTIHDSFAGAQFVTEITDMALAKGITLHIGTDFTQYARIIAQYRKSQPLGAPFDPTKQNVHQNNGFWITGWNDAGQLVHTQAMRRFALKNTLSEYLEERFRDFPPAGVDPDLKTSRYVPGPGAVFWHPTGQAGVLRGHMVWMAREDLAHMMAMPLRTLVA